MSINLIYHQRQLGNYKELWQSTWHNITSSGLYNKLNKIVISSDAPFEFKDAKVENVTYAKNDVNSEPLTLNYLRNWAIKEDDSIFLYLHSKGITKPGIKYIADWVAVMEYFTIIQHQNCFDKLKDYDVVGINLGQGGGNPLHFSGNIWWSKSSHLKTLPEIHAGWGYFASEFWVASNPNGKYHCLHNTKTNHYNTLYPKSRYIIGQGE